MESASREPRQGSRKSVGHDGGKVDEAKGVMTFLTCLWLLFSDFEINCNSLVNGEMVPGRQRVETVPGRQQIMSGNELARAEDTASVRWHFRHTNHSAQKKEGE